MNNKPFERVYEFVAQIPRGKVATYGQVAKLAGVNPRVVGFAMNGNRDMRRVPCHRVISTDGTLGGYALGTDLKQQKLKEEGVAFVSDGHIDLEKSLYTF